MKYTSFTIANYRAIEEPITVRLSANTIMPLVGINECGKTTILQGIFCFDYFNDGEYKGQHLKNLLNLYRTSDSDPLVSAEIELTKEALAAFVSAALTAAPNPAEPTLDVDAVMTGRFDGKLTITRNLKTKKYSVPFVSRASAEAQDQLAKAIVARAPYILYNDDFQDRPPDTIAIPPAKPEDLSDWLAIYERLFNSTDPTYSLFSVVKEPEKRRRDSIVSDVQAHLNGTLAKAWKTFLLDKGKSISVKLTLNGGPGVASPNLEVSIVEMVGTAERFFSVVDRSKGFLWFYNFVMKLEFNPKLVGSQPDTVYLLDEPGSYLHAAAQEKLCVKLKSISERHGHVIYCTHSHYLLNPLYIPLNNILIVSKLPKKSIAVTSLPMAATQSEKTTALRPVFEALQIPAFEFVQDDRPLIATEGIYDRYALGLFLPECSEFTVLPGTSADSIVKNIQFLNAYGRQYVALWDNDDEGRKCKRRAEQLFGPMEAKRFVLLPLEAGRKDKKMEQMIGPGDLTLMRQDLDLPLEATYDSVILELYFCKPSKQKAILKKVSDQTHAQFALLRKVIDKSMPAEDSATSEP